ncbi:MAG: RNA polymerase subunit sigma-70, partial [Wenzhouxiangella sp.]
MTDRPPPADDPPLTELLKRSADGDHLARDRVWTELHGQLRARARSQLARESAPQCDPTELVHEAFLKLDRLELAPRDRLHFLALAARAMRQVLVEQARAR